MLMGFFDGKVSGGFDRMFDRNRDGKMSSHERAMQMAFLDELEKSEEEDTSSEIDYDMSGIDLDLQLEMALNDRLLTRDEFEMLEEDEQEELLIEMGFNPMDFDF